MNPELIPTILEQSHEAFEMRLRMLENHVPLVHIDVLDGTLFPHLSFSDARAIGAMRTPVAFELHLMVENPLAVAETWKQFVPNLKRVIFHAELDRQHEPIVEQLRVLQLEVGIALNPETPIEEIRHDLSTVDELLIMTVHPGTSGQGIGDSTHGLSLEDLILKVTEIHKRYPKLCLGVDGGITKENILAFKTAGTSRFCIGSALSSPIDIHEFQHLLET